jgi:peptidoglycan/LPS O-acetylase OafA/YrhL
LGQSAGTALAGFHSQWTGEGDMAADKLQNGTKPPVRGGLLDLLRFLASVFIVTFHYGDAAPTPLASFHPALQRGYLATDFFLILSGYVLSRAYGGLVSRGGVGSGAFFAKRWARVWPAHVIILVGFVTLYLAASLVHIQPRRPDAFIWSDLPTQFFLLQALGVPGGAGWNLPTWTLSSLLICYGLFPVIWKTQARLKSSFSVLGCAICVVFAAAILAKVALGVTINGAALHYGLIRTFPMFLLGVAIARLTVDGCVPLKVAQALGVLGLMVFAGTELVSGSHDLISLAGIAAMVFAIAATPIRRASKLVAYGAEMSFSIYIVHTLWGTLWYGAYHAFAQRLHFTVLEQWAYWIAGVLGAVAMAALFFEFIDKPLQGRLRPLVERVFRPRPARYPAPKPNGLEPR